MQTWPLVLGLDALRSPVTWNSIMSVLRGHAPEAKLLPRAGITSLGWMRIPCFERNVLQHSAAYSSKQRGGTHMNMKRGCLVLSFCPTRAPHLIQAEFQTGVPAASSGTSTWLFLYRAAAGRNTEGFRAAAAPQTRADRQPGSAQRAPSCPQSRTAACAAEDAGAPCTG